MYHTKKKEKKKNECHPPYNNNQVKYLLKNNTAR